VLSGVLVRGGLQFHGGDDNDTLSLRRVRVGGAAEIRGGAGRDRVVLRDSTFNRDLLVKGDAHSDRYTFSRLRVKGTFNLRDLSGSNTLDINRLSVHGDAGLRLGTNLDRVTLDSSTFFSESLLEAGVGVDQITIRGSVFHGPSTLPHPNDWDDDVHREILLGWDFNDGSQGWRAAFDGYPLGQDISGDPAVVIPAEQGYELQASILNWSETGRAYLSFSGINYSDGLAFLAYRHLDFGLRPNAEYHAALAVDLVNRSPIHGEHVGYFAGTRTVRPILLPFDPPTARLIG
jgi:hypothetical protein